MEHFSFSHILGTSSSQLTFIFFRGVALAHQPVGDSRGWQDIATDHHRQQADWNVAMGLLPQNQLDELELFDGSNGKRPGRSGKLVRFMHMFTGLTMIEGVCIRCCAGLFIQGLCEIFRAISKIVITMIHYIKTLKTYF